MQDIAVNFNRSHMKRDQISLVHTIKLVGCPKHANICLALLDLELVFDAFQTMMMTVFHPGGAGFQKDCQSSQCHHQCNNNPSYGKSSHRGNLAKNPSVVSVIPFAAQARYGRQEVPAVLYCADVNLIACQGQVVLAV